MKLVEEFRVCAFVCEICGSNRKLLADLNASPQESSVINPSIENGMILGVCDVPHVLKLQEKFA